MIDTTGVSTMFYYPSMNEFPLLRRFREDFYTNISSVLLIFMELTNISVISYGFEIYITSTLLKIYYVKSQQLILFCVESKTT